MSNGLLNQLQHRVSQVFYNPFEAQSLKDCSLPYRIGKVAATAFASLTTGFLFLIALWALKRPPQNTQAPTLPAPSGSGPNALPTPDPALPVSVAGLSEQLPQAISLGEAPSPLQVSPEQPQSQSGRPFPQSSPETLVRPNIDVRSACLGVLEENQSSLKTCLMLLDPLSKVPEALPPSKIDVLVEQVRSQNNSLLERLLKSLDGPLLASPSPQPSMLPARKESLAAPTAVRQVNPWPITRWEETNDSDTDSDDDQSPKSQSGRPFPQSSPATLVHPEIDVTSAYLRVLKENQSSLKICLTLLDSLSEAKVPEALPPSEIDSLVEQVCSQNNSSLECLLTRLDRSFLAPPLQQPSMLPARKESLAAPTAVRQVNPWPITRWKEENDSDTDSVPSSKTTQARILAFQPSTRRSQAAPAPKPSGLSRPRARSADDSLPFKPAAAVALVRKASEHLTAPARSVHTVPDDSMILPGCRVTVTSKAAIAAANAESLASRGAALARSRSLSDTTLELRDTGIKATQLNVTDGVVAVAALKDQRIPHPISANKHLGSFVAEADSPISETSPPSSLGSGNLESRPSAPSGASDPRAVLSTAEASQEAPPAQLSHLATATAIHHTAAAALGAGLQPTLDEEEGTLRTNGPAGEPLVAPVATHPDLAKEPSARQRVIGLLLNLAAPVRGASLDPDVGDFFTRLHAVSMRSVPSLAMPPQRKVPDMSKEEEEAMRRLFIGGDVVGFLEKESATSKKTSLDAIKLLESQIKTKERELRELKGKKQSESQKAEIASADSCIGAYRRSIEHHLSNIAHIDRAEAEAKRIKELMKRPALAKMGEIESLMSNLSRIALFWLANRPWVQTIILDLRSCFKNEEFQAIFGSDQLHLSEEPRLTLYKLFQLPVIPKLLRSILTDSRLKQEADSTGIELLGKLSNDVLQVAQFLELAQNTTKYPRSAHALFDHLTSLKTNRSKSYDKPCICKQVLEDKYEGIIQGKLLWIPFLESGRQLASKLITFIREGIIGDKLVHDPAPLQSLIDRDKDRLVRKKGQNHEGAEVSFWVLPGSDKPFSPEDITPADKKIIINGFLELVFNVLKHCSESCLINNLIETILPEKFLSYLMSQDAASIAARGKSLTIKDLISSPKVRELLARLLPHLGLDAEIVNIIIKAMSSIPSIAACAKPEELIEIFNKTYPIVGTSAAKSISERDMVFNGPLFALYFMTVMKRKFPLVIKGIAGSLVKRLIG